MGKTRTPAELAGEIFDIIKFHESLWEQGSWFDHDSVLLTTTVGMSVEEWLDELENPTCGTTACVAGWAAIKTAPRGSKVMTAAVIFPDGTQHVADELGRKALGLTYSEGVWLFDGDRSKDEVLRALAALRDGQPFDIGVFSDEDDDYDDEYYDDDED